MKLLLGAFIAVLIYLATGAKVMGENIHVIREDGAGTPFWRLWMIVAVLIGWPIFWAAERDQDEQGDWRDRVPPPVAKAEPPLPSVTEIMDSDEPATGRPIRAVDWAGHPHPLNRVRVERPGPDCPACCKAVAAGAAPPEGYTVEDFADLLGLRERPRTKQDVRITLDASQFRAQIEKTVARFHEELVRSWSDDGVDRIRDAWVCRGSVLPSLAGAWQVRSWAGMADEPPEWRELDEHSGTGVPDRLFEVRPRPATAVTDGRGWVITRLLRQPSAATVSSWFHDGRTSCGPPEVDPVEVGRRIRAASPRGPGQNLHEFTLLDADGNELATGLSIVRGDEGPVEQYAEQGVTSIWYAGSDRR